MKVFGKIVAREKGYSNTSKRCNLCLTKKVLIITADRGTPFHKRSELISTYGHSRKFMLASFDPVPKVLTIFSTSFS